MQLQTTPEGCRSRNTDRLDICSTPVTPPETQALEADGLDITDAAPVSQDTPEDTPERPLSLSPAPEERLVNDHEHAAERCWRCSAAAKHWIRRTMMTRYLFLLLVELCM